MMLIVLISQHSTMGLPFNSTVTEEPCLEGFEMIKDQCMPIKSQLNSTEIESTSLPSKNLVVNEEKPVVELSTPVKYGACPEGMEHGEHGICQQIKPLDTTEITIESTTDLHENQDGEEHLGRCPEGTVHDEQGSCQEIKPLNPTKLTTDPKVLLKEDGSCPENYKMVEDRCLYVKPKINSMLLPNELIAGDRILNDMRPKSGNDASAKIELVPVLSDNSCPEGTVYSAYGLCEKRIRPTSSNLAIDPDNNCPRDFELINGKCLYKNPISQGQTELLTTISMVESTTFDAKPISNNELPKSISEIETTTPIVHRQKM